MPGRLDWWYRFRRVVGPPGPPATRAAVPSDLETARLAELAPVFAHVDGLEHELQAIEEQAARAGTRIRADASELADRITNEARTRAAVARAEAATALHAEHQRDAVALMQRAAAQADDVRLRAERIAPELVESAVENVRRYALQPPARG